MAIKKLFLTGASGVGKSYLLNSILGRKVLSAGGFKTVRLTAGGLRYVLAPASCADIERDGAVFLDYRVSPPLKNEDIFRSKAVSLLNGARACPFALIDETGGYEIMSCEFNTALYSLLASPLPVIGVIKGLENAAGLNSRFSLGSGYSDELEKLYNYISSLPDAVIVNVERPGDENAAELIRRWMADSL